MDLDFQRMKYSFNLAFSLKNICSSLTFQIRKKSSLELEAFTENNIKIGNLQIVGNLPHVIKCEVQCCLFVSAEPYYEKA